MIAKKAHRIASSHLNILISIEEMQSSQEEKQQIDPWDRIHDEVLSRHEAQLEVLIHEYEQNGHSREVSGVKADNSILSV